MGLIHRDIKPANVILCDRGGVPDSVKVLDFGLVKHLSDRPEAPATAEIAGDDGIVGTPNFIAPEAIQGCNQPDARSDLYSLGALGYFLLTGKEVFDSQAPKRQRLDLRKQLPVGCTQKHGRPADHRRACVGTEKASHSGFRLSAPT